MDGRAKAEAETELAMLKRIVAMLFALAGLAERASRASRPVCFFVVWLLHRAETVVREFVAGPAGDVRLAVRAGGSASDALDLAASLRALARDIADLSAQYRRFSCGRRHRDANGAGGPQRPAEKEIHRIAPALSALAGLPTAFWPDTLRPDTS